MGKRKRQKDLKSDGGVSTPADDEGMVGAEVKVKLGKRNRREATASLVNEANMMAEIGSLGAVVTAGKVSKRMNRSNGRQSARRSKEEARSEGGEGRAKSSFSWTSAAEIIILSELVEMVNSDTDHAAGRSGTVWVQLAGGLGERLGYKFKRRQIYEKVRRLRVRYRKILSKGEKLRSFKNDDDEKIHSLCHQVWGATQAISAGGKLHFPKREKLLTKSKKRAWGPLGALRLHLEEELGLAPDRGDVEKQASYQNNRDEEENTTSPDDAEVAETLRGLDLALLSEPNQGTTAADARANADLDVSSQLKARRAAVEGDIQKTLEAFRAEHQAVVKELEKRCATVVEDTQTKLLSMMSSHGRASQVQAIVGGGGGNIPSFGMAIDTPFPWDKLIYNCVSASIDKPAALQNLYEQWQQQRLQELKLTSMRLHLLLEDCKMEQEKLEKQVVKPK